MNGEQPARNREQIAKLGDSIYERDIRPKLEESHHGRIVAIDVNSGNYAIDRTPLEASKQLLANRPDAEIWLVRVGHHSVYRFSAGARGRKR